MLDEWFFALLHVAFTYTLITILHLVVPARHVRGYVHDGPPVYRLNGLRVFLLVSVAFTLCIGYFRLLDTALLVELRFKHAVCACLLGLLFTFVLVVPHRPNTPSFWQDLYLGRLKNPQWFGNRVDGKVLLYLLGGTGLQLNLIVFYFEHAQEHKPMGNVLTYVLLFSFFTTEYFYHEHVHLYTFDFIIEYVGFKLVWGCLVFYPFFYPTAMWFTVPCARLSFVRQTCSVGVFFLGWALSRGANNQKYTFRIDPKRKFLGCVQPVSVNGRLLCSGWWALSRHVNYLGDTLMAVGLSLAVNAGLGPWLYPLYYVALFIARERTDFERCREKYGRDWDEYCRRVPYRIVPFLY